MKIVNQEWQSRENCSLCGCTVDIDQKDIKKELSLRATGGEVAEYDWQCPRCNYNNDFDVEKIPYMVLEKRLKD